MFLEFNNQATEKPGTASVKVTEGCCHQTLPGTYGSFT